MLSRRYCLLTHSSTDAPAHVTVNTVKQSILRVQALGDISHSALCCHSNKTRAPIANPPNGAQLDDTPTIPPSYIRVRAVVWDYGEGQTDTQTAVTDIHFASTMLHAECKYHSV